MHHTTLALTISLHQHTLRCFILHTSVGFVFTCVLQPKEATKPETCALHAPSHLMSFLLFTEKYSCFLQVTAVSNILRPETIWASFLCPHELTHTDNDYSTIPTPKKRKGEKKKKKKGKLHISCYSEVKCSNWSWGQQAIIIPSLFISRHLTDAEMPELLRQTDHTASVRSLPPICGTKQAVLFRTARLETHKTKDACCNVNRARMLG